MGPIRISIGCWKVPCCVARSALSLVVWKVPGLRGPDTHFHWLSGKFHIAWPDQRSDWLASPVAQLSSLRYHLDLSGKSRGGKVVGKAVYKAHRRRPEVSFLFCDPEFQVSRRAPSGYLTVPTKLGVNRWIPNGANEAGSGLRGGLVETLRC